MLRLRAAALVTVLGSGVALAASLGGPVACGSFAADAPDEGGAESGTDEASMAATDASDAATDSPPDAARLSVIWAKSFGPTGDGGGVYAGSVAVAASGDSHTIGTYYNGPMDVAGTLLPSAVGEDAYVLHLSATGAVLSAVAVGTSGEQIGAAVADEANGAIEGFLFSFGSKLQLGTDSPRTAGGPFNAVVGRFNPVWSGEYPFLGTGNIQLRALAPANGAVLAFGEWNATLRIGASPDPELSFARATSGNALFVARLWGVPSLAATVLCDQGTTSCTAAGLAANDTGQAAVTGSFVGDLGLVDGGTATARDAYVAVLDASLAVVWARGLGGAGNQEGAAVASIPKTSDFVAAGTFDGTLAVTGFPPVATHSGSRDIFVARFDGLTGSIAWLKTFGGADDDLVRGITVDEAGSVYLAGTFASPSIVFGGGTLANAGVAAGVSTTDVYVAVLDGSSGLPMHSARFGGTGNDGVGGIGLDALGHLVLSGSIRGPADVGGVKLTPPSASAAFIAQLTTR